MPERPPFADLGLPVELVHSLRREGLEHAFPIQAAAIPDVLAGRDVLGRAATGSGKTLAFGLPMLVRLRRGASPPRRPRAVVLAPTRELALQIEQALDESAVALGLRTATAVGGMPIRRQADQLGRGVDLLVATPGRLADLIARQALALDAVRVAAVDEADHMSQLGFIDQVRAVLDRLPRDCQHLLFSATLDDSVDGLVRDYLDNPVRHAVETPADQLHDHPDPVAAPPDSSDRSGVAHHVLRVRTPDKRAVITEIAARDGRTLLFVRTQYAADKLARRLREAGVGAVALHGGLTQNQRLRTLKAFADGTAAALVATDVAARGIHVRGISLVVQVDPATDPKDYLHRAGRTGRAGAPGAVVTVSTDPADGASAAIARAGITAAEYRVRSGEARLAELTGARTPSGHPVPDPAAPPPAPAADGKPGKRPGPPPRYRRSRRTI